MTSSPPPALLSPTESQSPSNMPTAASGTNLANSNGKRPHGALLNSAEEAEAVETMPNNTGRTNVPTQTHASSGYRWSRAEDEPGYAWSNKKALDEMGRAWDALAHKDGAVKGELGARLAICCGIVKLTIQSLQAATETRLRLLREKLCSSKA